MYSFHLTGSPWFLLLIPAGLWILRSAYLSGGAPGRTGRILFLLQALALILLAVSLSGPELRKHYVRFHNPAVLILRDQSASFRAGAALGLGGRYERFQRSLSEAYAGRKFEVRVADFAASAWPVAGFRGAPKPPQPSSGDLTSLAAAAEFADSAAIPNLQAVFLFSDGRSVLDSGRSARAWRVPVYPVVFAPDSIAEVQAVSVSLDENGVEAKWEAIGRPDGDPHLRILQGKREVLARALPSSVPPGADGLRSFRFPWKPPAGAGPLRAVLAPSASAADSDPWNDTVAVAAAGASGARVFVLKPVRSLDEKGMLEALRAEGEANVVFFAAGEAAGLAVAAADQVWMEAGALADAKLASWLRTQPGKAVIYARSGEDGLAYGGNAARSKSLPGLPDAAWPDFPPAAEVRPAKAAAEAFPDEVVRLKSLTADPLRAPAAPAHGTWVEVREAGKRGMLMGRLDLGQGKHAFFFCLPAIWPALFDPQGDFAARENIGAYVRAAHALADRQDGAARVAVPRRAIAGLPFEAEIDLPEGSTGTAAFGVRGPGFAKEWERPAAAASTAEWTLKDIALPEGRYRAWARAGADTVWRDSLEAAPREALELARLGFDAAALGDLAARSGGSVLGPAGEEVTSMLPKLPAAQIRMDRTSAVRAYNTLPLCLIILALLALSWALRKKWDFD